ncbi:MAG TPA: hypothetical protein VIY48_00945 [Candidatus Paceibacterota bacterium]
MAKVKQPDIPESMRGFLRPDLPFDDRSLGGDTKTVQQAPDVSAQLAELSANLKRLEEQNQTLQRTNMALMGQPMQEQMPQFGPEAVNFDNLPDPVTNPKEYAAEIIRRGDEVLQARAARQNWENQKRNDITERVDGIWGKFAEQYPEYAANTDLVEYAATKAVAEAKRSGMDPNKYMFSATPAFFNDVVKTLQGLGVNPEKEDEEDTTPATRTAGIPGGLESGGRMTQGKDPDEERIPSLMEELRGWKEKTGFHA